MGRAEKLAKREAKMEKQLQQLAKEGLLRIDGEKDGKPIYFVTEKGRVLANKRLKGVKI